MRAWGRPLLTAYAMALAVMLVDLVGHSVAGGVGGAIIWLPTLVGLLAWRQFATRSLVWLLAGQAVGRGVIALLFDRLPAGFALLDSLVELAVVAWLGGWLRWRLPKSGASARDMLDLLLRRLLPVALLAGVVQAAGRQYLSPIAEPLLYDLALRFTAAHALALLAGCLLWTPQEAPVAAQRRRSLLLLALVVAAGVLVQAGLSEALALGFVLLAVLAFNGDRVGVLLGTTLLAFLPVAAEWLLPDAPGLATQPANALAHGLWASTAAGCLLLAAECLRRDAMRSQLSTLVQARTSALQAELQRRRRLEQRLAESPAYDDLTGTPNRALLIDRLNLALADARRQGVGLAVCCLELDGLKALNDVAGRSAGDAALVGFAERLRQRLRASDTVARVGGDEFVVLALRAPTAQAAAEIAERVLGCLDELVVESMPQFALGASLGIAVSTLHGEQADMLLRAADAAMQEVRRGGGSGWMLYAGRSVDEDEAESGDDVLDAGEPLPGTE